MYRFFERLVDPFPSQPATMPSPKLWAFLLHYARPLAPWLLLMSLLTALVSVVEVVIFSYLGSLVDWLSEVGREQLLADHGNSLLWMAALVVIGLPALVLLQSLVMHQTIFGNFPMLARWQMHRYLLGQSLPFFQDEFAGRVSQKVMQTALAVRETVVQLLDVFVYVLVYFIGALVLVGRADPWLMVPLLGWLAAYLMILWYYVPRLRDISKAQADARAQMTGRIVDSYSNIHTVKLFAHTDREQDYARSAMSGFMDTVYRQMRLVTGLTFSLQFTNAWLLAGIAGVAVYAWMQTWIGLGAVAVAIALVMRIRSMSEWIMWEVAGLFENIGTVQDGINTIAREQSVPDRPEARPLRVSHGDIRFDKVHFTYGQGLEVLSGLNLHIRPGEKVGLVGRSGAGKSTLVNLLLRFYELEAGRILIDDQDIATVTQDSLRQQIGMVTQDTSLLHRSISENVLYGRPDADATALRQALQRAAATGFVADLVDAEGRQGLHAHVGERGVKLSGGQRQRIAIARVMLKDAPILILDEATSALDSEIEAAIQDNLYALMEGKTVIAIAHRLSTIAAMDRLIVMDEGRIVEQGSHEALVARGGLYAQLWQRQSGGFLGDNGAPGVSRTHELPAVD